MTTPKKSLKSLNISWLWSVIAVDAIVLGLVAFPILSNAATMKEFTWLRTLGAGIVPVLVLLLTSLLPSSAKAVLVFWRIRDALPGHRAFSLYAKNDPRIDLERLRKNIGAFPDAPREQNTAWFKLYKKVESDVSVSDAHRHYLLFRDLAAISLILAPVSWAISYSLGASIEASLFAPGLMLIQYVATAFGARHNGVSLVTNVLALHSVKRHV